MMKVIVLLAVIVLVALVQSNRIDEFKSCFQTCRGKKNSFRFCVKFCKPEQSRNKTDVHAQKVLKEILGDDYAPQSDADPKASLDTLTPQSRDLWRKYKSVLLDFFRQGNPDAMPGLQLVMQPFAADWDQNSEVLNFLCNSIPQWGPSYEPSKRSFSTEYGDFLLNIKIPNEKAVNQKVFKEIDNRLREAEDKINEAEMECMERYDMKYGTRRFSFAGQPETIADYTAKYCLRLFREVANYDVVLAEYEALQYKTYGEHFALKRAIAKYATESRKGKFNFLSLGSMERFVEAAKSQRTNSFEIKITSKTKISTEKTFTTSYGVSFSLQNNPFASPASTPAAAAALQDVPTEGDLPPASEPTPDTPPTTPPTTTPTTAPTTPTTPPATEGGAKPFLSIGINYSSTKYEFKTSTEELQLIVGATGYKVFPVYPDRTWFSPEVLQKYKKYPLKKKKNYFSPKGTMPLYPKTLIIVVGPKLTMLVNKEDATKMEKSSQLKANIEVAGFKFDFAKDAKIKKETEANNLFKITIEGNSYEPQVLAVDNEILADAYIPKMN